MYSSLKEQVEYYFKTQEQNDKEILNQITLYIYYLEGKTTNSDLFILARILPFDYLNKLVSYYDGDILKMPSKEEFRKAYITAICFYLKEIKNWDWTQIKEFFPNNPEYNELLSSISIGKRINKIKDSLGSDLFKLLKNVKIEEIYNVEKEIKNER